MPFAIEYEAEVESLGRRPFVCSKCGYEAVAVVRSRGVGESTSPLALRNRGAREKASREAARDAQRNLEVLVSLATCPACGQRDRARIASLQRAASIRAAVVALFAWLFSLFFARGAELSPVVVLFCASVLVAVLVRRESWKWTEADQRVRVLSRGELESLEHELVAARKND